MSKRRKRRGHYCWSCQCIRPNERFSGKGRRRHLCKDCSQLGKQELAYRQAVRDIDHLRHWDGGIKWKHAKTFERFLAHANPRVRAYAMTVKAYDAETGEAYWRPCEGYEATPGMDDPFQEDTVFDILEDGFDFGPPHEPLEHW